MHEMALLSGVLDVALECAAENGAGRVTEVSLVVGEARDVVDALMESCFQFLSRGTAAEGARLVMRKVPFLVQCSECGAAFPGRKAGVWQSVCPECGGSQLSIRSGREFLIDAITVE